jgi:cell division protein FtsX
MKFLFYFKSSLKNIWNHKRQTMIFLIGIIASLSFFLSVELWSSTAEDQAAQDFIINQDYELKIRTFQPETIPELIDWLENEPLVQSVSKIYYNLAFFNAEEKSPFYRFMPLDDQEDMSDPVSLTSLCLPEKEVIERIANQFRVDGNFTLEENEVLISHYQANELEKIFDKPIVPGTVVNLSVAKRGPEMGEARLHSCQLSHFYNITIKGIYQLIPSATMLQNTFSADFLSNSIIFLRDNLDEFQISRMEDNGFMPVLVVKCNPYQLKEKGISQIISQLEALTDRMKIEFFASQAFILRNPTIELEKYYSFAQSSVIFTLPITLMGFLLTIYSTNVIISSRENEIRTLKDRGGQRWQILFLFLIEFLILMIIGILIAIFLSFLIAGFIPCFATGDLTWNSYSSFISQFIFPYTLTFYLSLGMVVTLSVFIFLRLNTLLREDEENSSSLYKTKPQKTAILSILGLGALVLGILIVIKMVNLATSLKNVSHFSLQQTKDCAFLFGYIMGFLLLITILLSNWLENIVASTKKFFKLFKPKIGFFLNNFFSNSRKKLSVLFISCSLLAATSFFSFHIIDTLDKNEQQTFYYNNGSDFRLQTTFVNYSFSEIVKQNQGIEDAMTVFQTSGKLVYTDVTVYAVDPIKYLQIGRWLESSSSNEDPATMLQRLNQTENGIILSETFTQRLNTTVGENITMGNLPNDEFLNRFQICGSIHSAPGLGLASGLNLELLQPYDEYVIINKRLLIQNYSVTRANIFLAKCAQDWQDKKEAIKESLEELPEVLDVNPQIINKEFIGKYIDKYIPKTKTFLFSQIILLNILALVLGTLNVNFVLSQRTKEYAILTIFGNTTKDLLQMISSEIFLIVILSTALGFLVGLPFIYPTIRFSRAVFIQNEIIYFKTIISITKSLIFVGLILTILGITTIPLLISHQHKKLVEQIKNDY